MAKLALALLCAAFALTAARELHQATAAISKPAMSKELQVLNERLTKVAAKSAPTKVSTLSLLANYDEYEPYHKEEDKYYKEEDKYYGKDDKYDGKEEDKYYGKDDKYYGKEEDKYYGKDDKYYGKEEDKYYGKDEKYYGKDEKYSYDKHYEGYEGYDAPKYYYGPNKVSIKLYEKFRSKLRPQPDNADTFQFTSELTCQNPAHKDVESEDGVIGFPLISDRMKLVTVGVCEWTVTLVKEQQISEHAILKGNTNVVCRFTKEAEHHCKHAEEVICDGMSVSGQGLVYNFEADGLQKDEYYKGKEAQAAADKADASEGLDVYLTLINGVVNSKEHKWDNGALQYFFGKPVSVEDKARDGAAAVKEHDPTGEYTFVFKH